MFEELSVGSLLGGRIDSSLAANLEFLVLLFLMMLTMNCLELSGILGTLGRKIVAVSGTERGLALLLTTFVFVSAAFLTNYIVLLGIVPLTIHLGVSSRIHVVRLVIFEGIAANAGSMLTPFGNPQNMFIAVYYNVPIQDFITTMLPLWIVSFIILLTVIALTTGERRLHRVHVKKHIAESP